MRVWEKNFIFTLVIAVVLLFTCIFLIIYTSFSTALDAEKDTAIHDEYHLTRAITTSICALEKRDNATFETIHNIIEPYADYYLRDGIRITVRNDTETFYSSFTEPSAVGIHSSNAMTCAVAKFNGIHHVIITDRLQDTQGEYWLDYAVNIEDIYVAQNSRTLFLLALSVAACVLLAIGLYISMRHIYYPINNLAHELRTPLTAISGYAEYLSIAALSEEERYSATKYIVDESRRLADITDKLLIMANLRGGKIAHDRVDIVKLLENTKMTFERVEYDVRQTHFHGDATLLQSAINNLVANAIKAGGDDNIVHIRTYDDTIEVADSGSGMSASILARVNKPSARYVSKDGSGLGIALCHQIAALHGAVLSFESAPGEGTKARFIFTSR